MRATDLKQHLSPVRIWFEKQGWEPLPFQTRTWDAHLNGRSGLIQVPTGSGKTYAAVMGPIARMLQTANELSGAVSYTHLTLPTSHLV